MLSNSTFPRNVADQRAAVKNFLLNTTLHKTAAQLDVKYYRMTPEGEEEAFPYTFKVLFFHGDAFCYDIRTLLQEETREGSKYFSLETGSCTIPIPLSIERRALAMSSKSVRPFLGSDGVVEYPLSQSELLYIVANIRSHPTIVTDGEAGAKTVFSTTSTPANFRKVFDHSNAMNMDTKPYLSHVGIARALGKNEQSKVVAASEATKKMLTTIGIVDTHTLNRALNEESQGYLHFLATISPNITAFEMASFHVYHLLNYMFSS